MEVGEEEWVAVPVESALHGQLDSVARYSIARGYFSPPEEIGAGAVAVTGGVCRQEGVGTVDFPRS